MNFINFYLNQLQFVSYQMHSIKNWPVTARGVQKNRKPTNQTESISSIIYRFGSVSIFYSKKFGLSV